MIIRLDAPATSREEAIAGWQKGRRGVRIVRLLHQFGAGASLDLRCAPVIGGKADEPRRVFIQAGSASEIIPQAQRFIGERHPLSGGRRGVPGVAGGRGCDRTGSAGRGPLSRISNNASKRSSA